jgi:hypothetical protein
VRLIFHWDHSLLESHPFRLESTGRKPKPGRWKVPQLKAWLSANGTNDQHVTNSLEGKDIAFLKSKLEEIKMMMTGGDLAAELEAASNSGDRWSKSGWNNLAPWIWMIHVVGSEDPSLQEAYT